MGPGEGWQRQDLLGVGALLVPLCTPTLSSWGVVGKPHRYCCRASHRPALVSRSLVASTRMMLMKRMKLSCGGGGAALEAAPSPPWGKGLHHPHPSIGSVDLALGGSVVPSGLGRGLSGPQACGALVPWSREASLHPEPKPPPTPAHHNGGQDGHLDNPLLVSRAQVPAPGGGGGISA